MERKINISFLLLITFLMGFAVQPVERFSTDDGLVIKDNNTQLEWQICPQNEESQMADYCFPTELTLNTKVHVYSWPKALEIAESHNGWRLPNLKELVSIINFNNPESSITVSATGDASGSRAGLPDIFPEKTRQGKYWTSTPSYQIDNTNNKYATVYQVSSHRPAVITESTDPDLQRLYFEPKASVLLVRSAVN